MKTLILLFLFLSSFANANVWVKKDEIEGTGSITYYLNESLCVGECYKVPVGFNREYFDIVDESINDPTRPIYEAKSSVVACLAVADDPATTEIDETKTQEQDCIEKQAAQVCDSSNRYFVVRLDDNSEVYCTRVVGYEQTLTGKKIVSENATKKAAYDSARAAEAAQEAAIGQALKAIEHGKRIIALLAVRNVPKGLTTAQIEQMNNTYKDIKNLLETGSLITAKEKINSLTPDGTLVTEGDKTALVAEIDKFLGL